MRRFAPSRERARAIAIAASIVLAPLVVLLIDAFAGNDYIVTRYLLELWVPFAVALAAALGTAADRPPGDDQRGGPLRARRRAS